MANNTSWVVGGGVGESVLVRVWWASCLMRGRLGMCVVVAGCGFGGGVFWSGTLLSLGANFIVVCRGRSVPVRQFETSAGAGAGCAGSVFVVLLPDFLAGGWDRFGGECCRVGRVVGVWLRAGWEVVGG